MATVSNLIPGDLVTMADQSATFVARTQHPIWNHLQLVVWRMPAGHPVGDWSHDALDARQDVGEVAPATHEQRVNRLRAALLGGA